MFPRDRRKSFLVPRPLSVSFDRVSAETRISLSHRGSRELQKGWQGFRLIGCRSSTATALEGFETQPRARNRSFARLQSRGRYIRPRGRGNFSIRLTWQPLKAFQRLHELTRTAKRDANLVSLRRAVLRYRESRELYESINITSAIFQNANFGNGDVKKSAEAKEKSFRKKFGRYRKVA